MGSTLLTGMRWIPSSTHDTAEEFRARQKARMREIEKQRKQAEARCPVIVHMRKGAKQ